MKEKDFNEVLGRVDELKALFHFVQRVIPLLEYLFHFLRDLLPVLEGINLSIKESSSKIPHAANKLNKVTEATELATTEILNIVEQILDKSNMISVELTTISKAEAERKEIKEKLDKVFDDKNNQDLLTRFKEAQALWRENSMLPLYEDTITSLTKIVEEIANDSSNIMIALQVQDITAQQIAAVNHMIESVHLRLSTLLGQFDQADFQSLLHDQQIQLERATFDPNATYSHDDGRQKFADKVIQQHGENDAPENVVTSQAEIDKMFMK